MFLALLASQSFWLPLFLLISTLLLAFNNHLLKVLLYLESLSVLMLAFLALSPYSLFPSHLFVFFIFVFMVCEAAAGLGVLVSFSRSKGAHLSEFSLFSLKKPWTFKV